MDWYFKCNHDKTVAHERYISKNDTKIDSKYKKAVCLLILILAINSLVSCSRGIKAKKGEEESQTQQEITIEKQKLENVILIDDTDETGAADETPKIEGKVAENVYLQGTNVGGFTKDKVESIIKQKASQIDKTAKNAKFDKKTWVITPEETGAKTNIQETLSRVLDADKGEEVKLVVHDVDPKIKEDLYKKNVIVIAKYTTPIVDNSESRMNNIELAIEKINNIILAPKKEFSFNRIVGNRTKEKGYENAPIIIKTEKGPEKTDGIGGGICQLSTTIFNAVEECGLKITERHAHSSDVTYAEEGEDAAVSYGYIDFKFINNRKYPIMIKISMNTKQLTVTILENRIK